MSGSLLRQQAVRLLLALSMLKTKPSPQSHWLGEPGCSNRTVSHVGGGDGEGGGCEGDGGGGLGGGIGGGAGFIDIKGGKEGGGGVGNGGAGELQA